jgi:CheY-like chemotaxis protein
MANETILVVDDAPVSLKLTDILLRKEGYKVHGTTDAEQALFLLDSLHPDLMLVDIQLPGMNGLELTRRVKQDSRTRDIVVVALTACAMKGDDDLAFKAGCDGYITKPIETLTLANKIREYLALRTAPPAAPPEEPVGEDPRGFPGGITAVSWKTASNTAGCCWRTWKAFSIFPSLFGLPTDGCKLPMRWITKWWQSWPARLKNYFADRTPTGCSCAMHCPI